MTNDELEAIRARDADYYAVFELHAQMFPGEAFRPEAQPMVDRHKLLREVNRLRDWQQEMIDAVNSGKVYRIRALIEEAGRE